ncbi:putative Ig domain-containing protein [Escherichia coli]|uniref:putative Ig domain-containing protein n=1 Tax=Escherichia coli TaxID=562 RepID=UPI0019188D1E|nr:putative Ig domain-containing protein [Escherichia coli]
MVTNNNAVADGTDPISVTYLITDKYGNPLDNIEIKITSDNGAIPGSKKVMTNHLGQATVNITNTTSGRTTVSASVNTLTADAELIFKPVIRVDVSTKMLTQNVSSSYNPVYVSSTVSEQLIFSISPSLPAGLGLNSTNGTISGTPTGPVSQGNYTITVRDGASGAEESADITLGVAPALSVRQQVYNRNIATGSDVNFSPLAISGGVEPIVSISPVLPAGLTLDPSTGVISGATNVVTSATAYQLSVTDSNGSPARTFTLTLATVNGPVITVHEANKMLTAGTSTSFIPVTATTTTGGRLTFGISPSLPAGLGLNSTNGTISGTPTGPVSQGNYTITVRDGASGAEESADITLGVAPALSVRQQVYNRNIATGSDVNFSPLAISGGVEPIVSISPILPAGLTLDPSTGVISGATNVVTSATAYQLSVTDSNGSPARTFTLTLATVNGPIITVNASQRAAIVNSSFNFTPITAVSPTGGSVTFSVSPALPAGLGLNSTNGKISGTPLSLFPETRFTMTIRDNKSGAEDMATFELSVVPNFTVKQTTYSKTLKAGMNSSFEVLSINGGSGRYSYSVTPQLPTGMQLELLQDSTMILSGTPSVTQGNTKYSIDIIDDLVGRTINRELSISIN